MGRRPFQQGSTFDLFRNLEGRVVREIDALENDYVLKASATELETHYISRAVLSPIEIDAAAYYIDDQKSTQIRFRNDLPVEFFRGAATGVSGTTLDIAVPYTGSSILWGYQPSTFPMAAYPELDVRDNVVVFVCTFRDDNADATSLKNSIDSIVRDLTSALGYLRQDVENFNRGITNTVRSSLSQKHAKAKKATGAIAALGIPIRRRDQPATFIAPTKRREVPIAPPKVGVEKYAPEPVLDQGQYEHILGVVKSMSLVIERSPSTFASLDEEAIRTHFLLQLNGHYEGGATGETFNASGKTDILIRVENRNIFIAECKFWRGEKSFGEAIDQLLGYLSWRDSKCALLVFNRTKNSSAVRQKVHQVVVERPEHKKTISHVADGDSRYVFVKQDDPGREIQICTMLFDLPAAEKE